MNILSISASAKGGKSHSNLLIKEIIKKLKSKYEDISIVKKDLVAQKIPHLDETYLNAFQSDQEYMGVFHNQAVKFINNSIEEIKAADIMVIGVPVYNFSIPSCLKAWIDHVVRAYKTFEYRNSKPVGLLKNKKVYLAVSSGGIYSSGDDSVREYAEPYMRLILNFIGISDITTFRIEGTAVSNYKKDAVEKGLASVVI